MKQPPVAPPAVEIRGLRKEYRIYDHHGRGWLKALLMPFASSDRFSTRSVALKGIDLTVRRGEVVGVLGRNGSGKSTLLRVIAGMTQPTAGVVDVEGSLRCMMASGVGFNARLTGRENIIIGSIAIGVPRRTAQARLDEIVEFAELEEHIDKPMMYYSRGMRSRLAVAVATQEVPDILVLDEAMSGGDAAFNLKMAERITNICASGSTVLIATHSIGFLRRLCTRAILLDDGRMVADGEPTEVARHYEELVTQHAGGDGPVGGTPGGAPALRAASRGPLRLEDAFLCDADCTRRDHFVRGERIELHVILQADEPVEDPRVSVELLTAEGGLRVAQIGAHYVDAASQQLARLRPERLHGRHELVVALPANPLASGEFVWRVVVHPWMIRGKSPAFMLRSPLICPFTSVAFPDRSWQRTAILEPESEIALAPLDPDSSFAHNGDSNGEAPVPTELDQATSSER